MSVNVTLNFIRDNWSSATRAMDRLAFCKAVLPDAYDHTRCENQGEHFFRPEAPGALSVQTLNGLMRGNRKSANNLAYASAAFTKDFQGKLQSNLPLTFVDPQRPDVPCVENMLSKIRLLVRYHGTPRTKDHPLFVRMDFGTLGDCDEVTRKAYRKIRMAIENLLERETETSLSYAIFLLVVTAILQDQILAVDHLYNPAAIEQILDSDTDAPMLDTGNRKHIPFTDGDYMNEYNVYLYHDTSNSLFQTGRLSMKPDGRGRSTATLEIERTIESPILGHQSLRRTFTGKPMLSQTDKMVYIPMTDSTEAIIYLTFAYTHFNYAPMYFRSALLISREPETLCPQVQRVAIVARELDEDELPYVKGLLKTDDKQLLISQKQLDVFLENFRDYPWMEDFKENYLPLFEKHLRPFYCFYEDELLSCSASDLPYEDRLRIMLALKSVDQPNDNSLHKFLRATAPTKTHLILK